MSDLLFSASWYRVAGLRPKLRAHARIHRHVYRGQPWYMLQDLTSEKFHRFTPTAHTVLGMMDGEGTVHEIWLRATEALGDDAPTQDDMIRLLAQLHAADMLQSDVPPDVPEMLERFEKKTRRERVGKMLNPLAVRVPLFDPERFLARGLPVVRPLIGWAGLALWVAVVSLAIVLVAVHWPELSEGFIDRVLTPQNLLLIWLIFPVIKGLHELGHGFVAKAFGGEIHDMGIMFLVFTPIPYVDASSASAFPEKSRRMLVGAAGMIVEVFLAALAAFVWVSAEAGPIRTVAYNAMLIGGITTVLFNGNPLLRFDGYYILADWLEIPNLRQRATAYLGFLFERYALSRKDAERPNESPGERAWLVGFGIASFVYRVLVVVAIFLFILEMSLLLGIVLILISSVGWIGKPLTRVVRALMTEPRFDDSRGRAAVVVGGTIVALVIGLGLIPVPYRTQAEGVVWIPDEALVRAKSGGFIGRVVAKPGGQTRLGDMLIERRDPDLEAEVGVLEARLQVLEARYDREFVRDRVRARLVAEERAHIRERLEHARQQLADLAIRAGTDGVFVLHQEMDLPGRWLRQGQPIAHVLPGNGVIVRAVVSEDEIDLVREPETEIAVRLADQVARVLPATIRRIAPTATEQLPSAALGSAGGGEVAIDPLDSRGMSAVEKYFVVELDLPEGPLAAGLGGRVHVRFSHNPRALMSQWYRGVRQLFLSRLDV